MLALVVFSPLYLIVALAIKLNSKGPVFYLQERVGRHNVPFNIIKFRSMVSDAESAGTPQLTQDNAPRVTSVGAFLRKYRIDELPQFWNVLIGDMSFVGPRPERKFYINQIMEHDPRYECLYQIRPGITSMATIYNGYTDTMDKMLTRLHMDLEYLEHRSWWLDIKIVFLTFVNIAFGKKF